MIAGFTPCIPGLVLTALLACASPAVALDGGPGLRVRVRFEEQVPVNLSEAFTAQAERLLRQAGLRSTWIDCTVQPVVTPPAVCSSELSQADVVVQVLPRRMVGRELALGLAYANEEGGNHALIFLPAVSTLAQKLDVPLAYMIALAAFHEVGHLLLGSKAHWPWGIMNPFWSSGKFDDVTERGLLFNASQVKVLKERIARRVAVSQKARGEP